MIFDGSFSNGNVLDGFGMYEYEIQCFGFDIFFCGDFIFCIGLISVMLFVLEIIFNVAVICFVVNFGFNILGGM